MSDLELFPRAQIVGVFRGFRDGGMEFHADLVLPYRSDFQNIPMHGQFLLVQLETPDEAVLGRITSLSSEGKLSAGAGEEFSIRAVQEQRPVPEELRQQYLKYRVDIRVLGVLRRSARTSFGAEPGLTFAPSHRRLPHVGSPVAFPSGPVLREIAGHNLEGAAIGHFALGEYIYAGDDPQAQVPDWAQLKEPQVLVKFPVQSLVSRRTFIFARAGFGKSNLNKLLFSTLYRETPTVEKRGGRRVPVGTVIFDPDGEYFWPDDKGRPALCDVPWLEDRLVVFTARIGPSPYYQSFVAGGIRLDLRRLKPADVVGIALSAERQEQQNVRKLRELSQDRWERLIDLIDQHGHQAPLEELCALLGLDALKQEMEALAARGNMTAIVRALHDRSSQLMDMLLDALKQGKLCVVDVSQLRGAQALMLSGLILRRIFDRNQEQFTAAAPQTIPTIAVVEEAQAVLRDNAPAAEPYIAWVKEGRKYDLGAVLVTQQPGSIPTEILSQGDNWFLFHLLSAGDLASVRKANAHFSDDLLGALLNEPIAGQGVFWSSVGGKPYPVALRALSFEAQHAVRDPGYNRPAAETFASQLKEHFEGALRREPQSVLRQGMELGRTASPLRLSNSAPYREDVDAARDEEDPFAHANSASAEGESADGVSLHDVSGTTAERVASEWENTGMDALTTYRRRAIQAFQDNPDVWRRLSGPGLLWSHAAFLLKESLPTSMDNRDTLAFQLVREALDAAAGPQCWETFRNEAGKRTVRCKEGEGSQPEGLTGTDQ